MNPEDKKFWSYTFNLRPGQWSWGAINPRDWMTDEEFAAITEAAMNLFEMTELDLELEVMDALEEVVRANDCSEAAAMIEEALRKQA